MKEICNIVGSRIRFIRRQKGYTLNDFADAIHRGKSTVSKYERGEISIDIETLADISRVLGVSLASLVDDSKSTGVEFIFRPGENEYAEHLERYYLYFYSAHVGKPYISYNALFIGEHTARIFGEIPNDEEVYSYKSCYIGHVRRADSFVRVFAVNPMHKDDIAILEYRRALKAVTAQVCFFCTLSIAGWFPMANKALISSVPVKDKEWIRRVLTITSSDMREIKARNGFFAAPADFEL